MSYTAAEEGRVTTSSTSSPRQKPVQHHRHGHGMHLHQQHQRRKAKREAAMRRKLEGQLPSALHGETMEQTQKRLSIKNEAVAALAEFCGTFCRSWPSALVKFMPHADRS
jgi:hypothetical protein